MKTTPIIDHEVISRRAHRIWELAGKPEGRETEIWLQAELELRLATVQSHDIDEAIHTPAPSKPAFNRLPENAPHSKDYAPAGVTTDALHHRRSK